MKFFYIIIKNSPHQHIDALSQFQNDDALLYTPHAHCDAAHGICSS
jgi:hypothetical protein